MLFVNKFKTKKVNGGWLDKENSEKILNKRFEIIRKGLRARDNKGLFILKQEHLGMLDNDRWFRKLLINLKKKNIQVIFIDTMHRFAQYKENSADDINDFYLNVLIPLKQNAITPVLIHHTTKAGEFRGSSDIKGMLDNLIKIKKDRVGNVWINYEKIRDGVEISSIAIKPHFDNEMFYPELLTNVEMIIHKKTKEDILSEKILKLMGKGKKQRKDIEKVLRDNKVKFSDATFGRCLHNLTLTNKIAKVEKGVYQK